MGRFVEASEVAALATFLLSPEAGAITGQQIVICAGAFALMPAKQDLKER
jgi:3-oxoacyl-[acyl-carrier protein] reductase